MDAIKGKTYRLERDCRATLIPAGDTMTLSEGTEVAVSQALGGSVTVQARGMLYRIGSGDLDALGEEVASLSREMRAAVPDVGGGVAAPLSEDSVWTVLRQCFDPEIPINIVDLGLIYDLRISEMEPGYHAVQVKMTLTAQGCGMGPVIAEDAREKILALPGVESATVDVVWDPPWSPHMISPEGRRRLGLE